jgi:hypothetical protein
MKTPEQILRKIQTIQTMERGTLCKMKSGPYFNHQTWRNRRNHVRYVPQAELPALKVAIAGYRRFLRLTQQYADLIIQRSRNDRAPATRKL